jgi:Electron transfer DM13
MRIAIIIPFAILLSASAQAKEDMVKGGMFHGGTHAPADTVSGTATLIKTKDGSYALKMSDDFSATPGPDLVVYLSTAADPVNDADVKNAEFLSAGKLASPSGGQIMPLPQDFDPAQFKSVAIWCEQFSVLFGAAPLK